MNLSDSQLSANGRPRYNDMQLVKREFFALRNGVIADALRRSGSPFSIIFGLNMPQLSEIASAVGPDADLAQRLWANTTTRESMMLAPMIWPLESLTKADALKLLSEVPAHEIADVLCFRLLRKLPFAAELLSEVSEDALAASEGDDGSLTRYSALRLALNLQGQPHDPLVEALARKCADSPSVSLRLLANQLLNG